MSARRHEQARRAADGPGDAGDADRVAPAGCAHCVHYYRESDPPRPADGACCCCGARNGAYHPAAWGEVAAEED